MNDRIYLSSPDVTEAEEHAVVRAFRSGWIAPVGPDIDAFESALATYCGRQHCIALSSGTAALHLGLLTLGVGPGDIVLTSSMTFAATANAIVYTGAEPVFIDSDETGNMNPALLELALSELTRAERPVKAVVPVDLLGKVADHARIDALADDYGIPVLSDAAESLGSVRCGRPAASFGRAAVLSFNGNKIMTTSGGGALLTDDIEIATRVRHLATQARQPVAHYEHHEIGYNYRLSNLLAALGHAQLGRLDSMIDRRASLRRHYIDLFSSISGVGMFGEPSGLHGGRTRDNFWLTSILIDERAAGFSAQGLRLALAQSGIEARALWKPMHRQPVFAAARSYLDGTSDRLYRCGLSLPSSSVLDESQIARIDDAVRQYLEAGHGGA